MSLAILWVIISSLVGSIILGLSIGYCLYVIYLIVRIKLSAKFKTTHSVNIVIGKHILIDTTTWK